MLACHFIAEMGVRVFGAARWLNNCHPRGGLIEDLDLRTMDSRSDTSGMTIKSTGIVSTQSPTLSTGTKSACTNAGMNKSVHVFSSWMMNKAMSAHGCAISAVTSKTLLRMQDHVWVAGPRESRGMPEAVSLWVSSPPRQC